jgi:hypothetical protein
MEPNLEQLSLDPLPHQQHISNILAQEGAQVVAGTVLGNVTFGSNDYRKSSYFKGFLGSDTHEHVE